MKILEVHLEGYLRLKLNKVNSIKLNASELIQLIIGTNGSGKSSLLEQVNCWVANRNDFKVGGKKVVKMEHNNTLFETRQYFNKKNSSFEFIVDGVNINEGETGAVQKELIKMHFGLDGDLIDLFLGKTKFTRMNPTQRREILTKISGLDLTYAIGLHKRVASAGRDVAGAKKLLDKRMVNETANVWKDEDWEQWKSNQTRISDTLTSLMSFSRSNAGNFNEVNQRFKQQQERMRGLVNKYFDEYMSYENLADKERNIFSGEDYRNELATVTGTKTGLVDSRATIMGELEELEKEVADLRKLEDIDADKWSKIKTESEKELAILKDTDRRFLWTYGFDQSLYGSLNEVTGLMQNLLDGKTKVDYVASVERAEYDTTCITREENRKSIVNAEALVQRMQRRIKDIEEAKNEECPKCKHVFIPGVSDKELAELKEKVIKGTNYLSEQRTLLEQQDKIIHEYELTEANMRDFRNIVNGYMMFRGVWKEVIADEVLYNSPLNVLQYLDDALDDVKALSRIMELETTILEAERNLIKAGETSNVASRMESIGKREVALTSKLDSAVKALEELDKDRIYLQGKHKRADFVSRAENAIVTMLADYEKLSEERIEALRELRLQEDIQHHQQRLANINRTIQEQETQRGILKDLENQSEGMEESAELWKLLTTALSPTQGLIAEQLLGFMHKFTESLNGIIEKIWTHDLRVLPCKGSGDNLDYKFPMVVDGDGAPVPDIGMGSTGQIDVIDFAFTLVAMSYLGMEDYPLYADELGSSFDEEHRENLQRFLKLLIDSSNCSQLWLISHAYAVQNSLGACETCVVDKSNITVPVRYNEHVEFG